MLVKKPSNDEAAILTRVVQPAKDDLPVAAARALLTLAFVPEDRERMHLLAEKNQAGTLTDTEREELSSYLRVGRLLDLLAARARLSLARKGRGA